MEEPTPSFPVGALGMFLSSLTKQKRHDLRVQFQKKSVIVRIPTSESLGIACYRKGI